MNSIRAYLIKFSALSIHIHAEEISQKYPKLKNLRQASIWQCLTSKLQEIEEERDSLAHGGNSLGQPSFVNNKSFYIIKNIIS